MKVASAPVEEFPGTLAGVIVPVALATMGFNLRERTSGAIQGARRRFAFLPGPTLAQPALPLDRLRRGDLLRGRRGQRTLRNIRNVSAHASHGSCKAADHPCIPHDGQRVLLFRSGEPFPSRGVYGLRSGQRSPSSVLIALPRGQELRERFTTFTTSPFTSPPRIPWRRRLVHRGSTERAPGPPRPGGGGGEAPAIRTRLSSPSPVRRPPRGSPGRPVRRRAGTRRGAFTGLF